MKQTYALSASRGSLCNLSCSSLSFWYSSKGSNCMNIKIFTHNILVLLYSHDPFHYVVHFQNDSCYPRLIIIIKWLNFANNATNILTLLEVMILEDNIHNIYML